MTTLAQVSPPDAAVGQWLAIAFYIVGGITAGVMLYRQLTGKSDEVTVKPETLTVKHQERFMTREDHEKFAQDVSAEFTNEARARKGMYEKIEAQGNRLARVEEKTDSQTRQLTNLDSKMDQVLLRLPRPNSR